MKQLGKCIRNIKLAASTQSVCKSGKSLKRWSRKRTDLEEVVAKLLGDAAIDDAKAVVSEHVMAREAEPKGSPGTVGAYVESMLITDAAYDEIVAAVRERLPEARTSRRSVASVASAMQRRGADGGTRTRTIIRSRDFLTPYGFRRRRLRAVCGLDYPFAVAGRPALGAARLVSTRSPSPSLWGFARDCHQHDLLRFPRI